MKHDKWITLSLAALLAASEAAWPAAGPGAGLGGSVSLNGDPGIVERGGTITAVNQERRTISVDRVTYPLSYTFVPVHYDSAVGSTNVFKLKQGTKIRFRSKQDFNGQARVQEIWVANYTDGGAGRQQDGPR